MPAKASLALVVVLVFAVYGLSSAKVCDVIRINKTNEREA